jgi:hypothetical protein
MQFYVTISAFTMLGAVHLAATVRSDSPGEATERALTIATDVPDDGETDPHAFLASVCSWLLEDLSNDASHAL